MRGQELSPILATIVAAWLFFGGAARGDVSSWSISKDPPPLVNFTHTIPTTPLLSSSASTTAVPTSAFWTSLILGDGHDLIAPLPYLVQSTSQGLAIGYPPIQSTEEQVVALPFTEWTFSAVEELHSQHRVTAFDELSVWLRYPAVSDDVMSITFPIVRGAPYVTALYTRLVPELLTDYSILHVNNLPVGSNSTSTRFVISLSNGNTWTLYVPSSTTLLYIDEHTLRFLSPFSGVARLAAVPSADVQALLDAHSLTYPTSAIVSYSSSSSLDSSTINFEFSSQGNGGADLLMLALPHHVATMNQSVAQMAHSSAYRSTIGPMRLMLGSKWEMIVDLPAPEWISPLNVSSISPEVLDALHASLGTDTAHLDDGDHIKSSDVYNFGVAIARVARLALIAEQLSQESIAASCRSFIDQKIRSFLDNDDSSINSLVYESAWRSVVSRDALFSDVIDDGNGWFNDHHIHYSPLLFAAGVLLKHDSNVWHDAPRIEQKLQVLVRDVVNPSSSLDPFFPVTRHKDWFTWLSGSAGVSHSSSAIRSTKAISESIDSYHSIAHYALASHQHDLTMFARLLTATELVAAKNFYITSSPAYDGTTFASSLLVHSLSATQVTSSDLIRSIALYTRPISPLLPHLLDPNTVASLLPRLQQSLVDSMPIHADVFRSHYWIAASILNATTAFASLASLSQFSPSESRTNALYFAATQTPLTMIDSSMQSNATTYYQRVLFSTTTTTSSSSSTTIIDTGAGYSSSKGHGWLHASPLIIARSFPLAFYSSINTVATLHLESEWQLDLPAAGDYVIRLALAPSDNDNNSTSCDGLEVLHDDQNRDRVFIGSCSSPISFSTSIVSLSSPRLRLRARRSPPSIAMIQVFAAEGVYLEMSFDETTTIVTSSLLASVTGVAAERLHVSSRSTSNAVLLVVDQDLFASSVPSHSIVFTLQQTPQTLWLEHGLGMRSIVQQTSPPASSSPRSSSSLTRIQIALITLTSIIIIALVLLFIFVLYRRRQALLPMLRDANAAPRLETSSTNSHQDLLRATSSSALAVDVVGDAPSPPMQRDSDL